MGSLRLCLQVLIYFLRTIMVSLQLLAALVWVSFVILMFIYEMNFFPTNIDYGINLSNSLMLWASFSFVCSFLRHFSSFRSKTSTTSPSLAFFKLPLHELLTYCKVSKISQIQVYCSQVRKYDTLVQAVLVSALCDSVLKESLSLSLLPSLEILSRILTHQMMAESLILSSVKVGL